MITKDNKLLLGNKHHFLSNRQDVLAAGQLRLSGSGQIRRIDNLSGHFRPTAVEAMQSIDLLKNMGLNLKGATFEAFGFKVNPKGYVIEDPTRLIHEILK